MSGSNGFGGSLQMPQYGNGMMRTQGMGQGYGMPQGSQSSFAQGFSQPGMQQQSFTPQGFNSGSMQGLGAGSMGGMPNNPAFGGMQRPPMSSQPGVSMQPPTMDPASQGDQARGMFTGGGMPPWADPRMQQARMRRGGYVPPGMDPISTVGDQAA